jgi:hypothetical protein
MVQVIRAFAVAFLIIAAPGALAAQASPYVPMDDVSYRYVDALMSRGIFGGLSVLERPYHVRRIRAAIDSARAMSPGRVVKSYLDALSQTIVKYELRKASDTEATRAPFRAKASFDFYGTAETSSLRELMLADWREEVKPGIAGYFVMGGGHLAASVRAILDNRLNVDPEFAGRKDRSIAGRTEDAYIAGEWKYAEAALGRVSRSWGPIGLSGLQLGNDAYTYDHLYSRFGIEKIHLSTVIARLENYVLSPGVESSRYLATHRLAFNRGRLEGGLSESFLYSGVGRGIEFSLVNPLNVYALSWRNERTDGNLSFGGDIAYRSGRLGTFSAQVLIDDIQIDRCDTICHEPSAYGMTVTAEGVPLIGDQRAFASYTRVSNLAYRTPNVAERYASYNVGVGRGWSDYDEVRIGADLALIPRTPLRLYGAYRRQGEGDYRLPYPPQFLYETTSAIFSGVVQKTARIGLSGASTVSRDFAVTADLGFNHTVNRYHNEGSNTDRFEGRAKVVWIPRWLIRFD